ncbi:MAG: endo-1,4-beta-xylanase [Candidatus Saccharimonadales bacterium]
MGFTRLRILAGVLVTCLLIWIGYFVYNQPRVPNLPQPPLKVLAANHHIELGNFAIYNYLNVKPYTAILTSQFNLALIDNTPNWYFTGGGLRPSPTTYNFQQMDQIVKFAEDNHMAIQAHHLVWGEQKWLPNWLKNGHYSPNQLLNIMHSDILTVAGRYQGKVKEWSVVNEAFTREQHIYGLRDWWADNIGNDSYISDAFIWAHQADPSAVLILNDFDDQTQNPVSDAMYNYIKTAKANGVPIDGIGMQMHLDGTHPPSQSAVVANMRRFAQIGVMTYVTEFDVNMSGVKASAQIKDQKEAAIYYDMTRACIESGSCPSFSILGVTDKETWYNYLGTAPNARPLPFDEEYKPKPAFYALRLALSQP